MLALGAPAGAYRAEVEALDPASGHAGRFGQGFHVPGVPPDAPVLSELLVLEPGPLPGTAREALARLRVVEAVEAGERVPVAWELWGLGWREEALRYRLSLEETDGGLIRGIGRLFGVGDPDPVVLEWEEPGPAAPGAALRSTFMQLPSLDPGDYLLRLEVTAPGRNPLVSQRPVRVVEAGGGAGGP